MNIFSTLLKNKFFRTLAKQKGIREDIFEYINAITAVGQPSEVQFPLELLPILVRLVAKGAVNLLAVQPNLDWVWPFYIVRQFDPAHQDFVGRGHLPISINLTHRNWTAIGCLDSKKEAIVDKRGLITPKYDGWSMDIWLHIGEKLIVPSRIDTVKQNLLEQLPIVRTSFVENSIEVLSYAFAARLSGKEVVVQKVTLSNIGVVDKELQFYHSLRPYNADGISLIKKIKYNNGAFYINDKLSAVPVKEPDFVDCSNEAEGDVSLRILSNKNQTQNSAAICKIGLCTAVSKYGLSLSPGEESSLFFVALIDEVSNNDKFVETVLCCDMDELEQKTIEEWNTRLSNTIQIKLPEKIVEDAFNVNKGYLLLLYDVDEITPGPFTYHHFWFRDAAYLVSALDKIGLHSESEKILNTYPKRQRHDGFFISQDGEWDANGQAMFAILEHYKYTGAEEFLKRMYPAIHKGVRWIENKRKKTKKNKKHLHYGLLPAGFSAEHLGPNDYFYWDDFWCLGGINCALEASKTLNKKDDEANFQKYFESFWTDIENSLLKVEKKLMERLIPASPYRRMNSGAIGTLCALYPLRLLSPNDERLVNTLNSLRKISFFEDGFFQHIHHSGVNIYLTLQFAQCLLFQRNPEVWKLFYYVLSLASPTYTWPEAVNPITKGGIMGDGHHGWAAADFLHLVRNLLFFEEENTLVLLPVIPYEWLSDGKYISVKNAPSYFGIVNFSLEVKGNKGFITLDNKFRVCPKNIEINFSRNIIEAIVDNKKVDLKSHDKLVLQPNAMNVTVQFTV